MANGNVMGLLGNFIQQNPNMLNQLQPPMTTVSGGVNSFPNAFDPGSQKIPFGTGMRTADFRDSNNDGIDDRDQGFQNFPGFNRGVNLPINIGNNPSLNPIQDGMFRPPMQQPVQNQMPVAGSFLDQLQQSTQVLNNQIRNVVPQNSFVGNQFQMPFNFGGGYGYQPSNFTYTPQPFNQYGNMFGFNLPFIPGMEKTTLPVQDREGRSGERGGFSENQAQDRFTRNPDGSITKFDASENQFSNFMPSDINLSFPDMLFARLLNLPTIPNVVRGLLDGSLGMGDAGDRTTGFEGTGTGQVGSTGPTAYSQARALAMVKAAEEAATKEGQNQQSPTGPLGGQVGSGSQPQGPFGIGDKGKDKDKSGPQGGGGSGQSGPDAAGAKGSSFCFAPDTLIQMADGSEKEIQNIKLGDNTKGGKVELVVQTLGHNVYNYKGVEVSGSHWVVEDGEYIEVETSKHAQPIDDKEMLYCLNTSDHAIWVKEIQFSDFIGFGLDYSVPGVHKFWESIKDRHTESIN